MAFDRHIESIPGGGQFLIDAGALEEQPDRAEGEERGRQIEQFDQRRASPGGDGGGGKRLQVFDPPWVGQSPRLGPLYPLEADRSSPRADDLINTLVGGLPADANALMISVQIPVAAHRID